MNQYFEVNGTARNIINKLAGKPRTIFLVDSLGALLTVFLLFAVLRNFNEYFGIPATMLTFLSVLGASFCIYSASCFIFLKHSWAPFLTGIAIANLLYCMLTITLLIIHFPQITIYGIIYFTVEIAIICGMAYIELNIAGVIKKNALK